MTETTRPYPRVVKDFKGVESRTHQSFKDEVNINTIVQKWLRTGEPPINPGGVAQYGDSTAFTSYHDALNTVAAANELFSSLPSRVRERMKNSPAELLRFVADPDNLNEAIELGLMASHVELVVEEEEKPTETVEAEAPTTTD